MKNTRDDMENKAVNDVNETAESDLEAQKQEFEEQAREQQQDQISEIIAKKEEEINDLNSRFLRLNADFQNYKKRAEKEKADVYQFGNEKMIADLLPILDNLERANSSANEESAASDSIAKGVEMVIQQFKDILKKHGVEEIQAVGEAFDPNLHHAVMQEDHADYEANRVIDVFQKGYTLNGKVIRPSMVKVSN
ncbi:MAG: nucleotide exchange factor GrpE [Anaerosolibacter sp.]|uniref:nucleotide exchange factor GrpE n=1 Tax=Anaerosolibacter sp. TaxID=1872527 RepID=UPI00263119B7|nr:nucleotide exchange factor GrpE [Anaerosolibacter sp.]MDF2548137.1 nucleotide exchange factor GrpE [Anaerosolibacter sp.]